MIHLALSFIVGLAFLQLIATFLWVAL